MLICSNCGTSYSVTQPRWRSDCGGYLMLRDTPMFSPEALRDRQPALWRYREALGIAEPRNVVSLGEGYTPLVEMTLDGFPVMMKLDYLCPTGSYKDRGSTVMISKLKEWGVPEIIEDSSGNAGASVAAYAAFAGIQAHIYIPESTSAGKAAQIEMYGADLVKVRGTREDTARAAWQAATRTFYASHNWNPWFLAGMKTAAYEIAEQLGWETPDWVVTPAGGGSLLVGLFLGFVDLLDAGITKRIPRLAAVQSAACDPIYRAWMSQSDDVAAVEKRSTAAEGILTSQPGNGIRKYASCPVATKSQPMTTLIANATVVDVHSGESHAGQNVRIENGRILAISQAASQPALGRFDEVLDASGYFVCPGLIDCHVHLFLDGGADPRIAFLAASDEERLQIAESNAALAISAGVTTVRDCGGPAKLVFLFQKMADSGYVVSPRILAAGAPLTRPGGHCHFFGIEVANPGEVARAVDAQARQGAAFVKVMASGGGLTPGTNPAEADLPLALMQTAVKAARANGLHVAAHCHAVESIVRALDAGVAFIEHATFATPNGPPAFDPEIAARIGDRGVVVSPTAISGMRIAQAIREHGVSNGSDRHAIARLEARRDHIGPFLEAGVRLIAGTDCGVTNVPFDSLVAELREYVNAGMSCEQALRSATSDSADCLGERWLGQVKPGFAADLLLLTRNPLLTIDALLEPVAVWKAGRMVHDRRGVLAAVRS